MSAAAEFERAATAMAEQLAERLGLDFSRESLQQLEDELLKAPGGEQAELALAAGAYLAEVVRRRAPVGLRWVPSSVLPGVSDPANPFLLATPKNLVFAVLGKPKKRLEKSAGEGLIAFANAVQDLCSREATALS